MTARTVSDTAKSTGWTARLNLQVGREVARHRRRLDLRQDQLADLCTRAGFPLSRSKLANLERGHARQEGVSVAEVIILAHALGVSPLSLIFPPDRDSPAEVRPGVEIPRQEAGEWFTGQSARSTALPDASGRESSLDEIVTRLARLERHLGSDRA